MLAPELVDLRSAPLVADLCSLGHAVSFDNAWWHRRAELIAGLSAAAVSALHLTVQEHLFAGCGAVIVRAGQDVPPDSVRLLQLLIGEQFGDNITIAPDEPGRPLFRISAVEGKGQTGDYTGNAKKREPIGFHTDGSGVPTPIRLLSMACIRPARDGGESRLADSREVHPTLTRATRRVLESPLPRENPYRRLPPEQLMVAPIFDPRESNRFSYHPMRVRNGITLLRGSLTRAETDALAELDYQLERSATEMLLGAGDILMLDNLRIAHDRRSFDDDPSAPRLIERLWIGERRS